MSEWCVGWLNRWKTNLASHTDWLFAFWNKIVCVCVCVCVCVHMCVKYVLPILREDQIQMNVITAGLEWSMHEPDFLSKIITGDESWGLCLWSSDEMSVLQMVHQNITWKEEFLGHRIWAEGLPDWFFFSSLGMVCHKFVPLGHSEAFGWCHLVEETGKWCALARPSYSAAGFDEEPNLNHPPSHNILLILFHVTSSSSCDSR